MAFSLDHVVLAQLDLPTSPPRTQLNELLQPGGQRVEPASEYEAHDSTGTIRITVDARRQVTDVDIQLRWMSRIPAAQLAGVLFQTYVTAIQRAMVVELANAKPPAAPLPVSETPVVSAGSRSFDEWNAMIRARMSDIDEQLERIHRIDGKSAGSRGS